MRPAIQLHSVRELDCSLPEVIHRVSEAGFEGVEFASRFHEADSENVADALETTGVVPIGGHVGLGALEADPDRYLRAFDRVGCERIGIPHLAARHFRTRGRIETLAARMQDVALDLDDRGFELFYHNTRYDLAPPITRLGVKQVVDRGYVPGVLEARVLEKLRLQQTTDHVANTGIGHLSRQVSGLGVELDAGEIRAAQCDHQSLYEYFGDDLIAVHVCDVTDRSDGYHSTSPGSGVLDFDRVFSAARRQNVEWLVYEHDHPEDPVLTIDRGAEAVVEPLRREPARINVR